MWGTSYRALSGRIFLRVIPRGGVTWGSQMNGQYRSESQAPPQIKDMGIGGVWVLQEVAGFNLVTCGRAETGRRRRINRSHQGSMLGSDV
jgi:hypothetical protein